MCNIDSIEPPGSQPYQLAVNLDIIIAKIGNAVEHSSLSTPVNAPRPITLVDPHLRTRRMLRASQQYRPCSVQSIEADYAVIPPSHCAISRMHAVWRAVTRCALHLHLSHFSSHFSQWCYIFNSFQLLGYCIKE